MTTQHTARLSRWTVAALVLALAAVVLLVAAPVGYRLGLWGYPIALLKMTPAAAAAAALGTITALVAVIVSWRRPARRGLPVSLAATAVAGATLVFLLLQVRAATSVPEIHDITTDPDVPPAFEAVLDEREAQMANPHRYGGPSLAAVQRDAYPDIQPYSTSLEPPAAFERALAAARALGWQVVEADQERLRIEASDTTLWYGFIDDVVVRVTAVSGGSRIDVRSLSRVGRSDVGKNAARIRAFFAALDD